MRTDTNERAELAEVRGVVAEDLPGALREMEAVAAGTRSTKPFYHASINTRADEPLTDTQRAEAIDRLETALGLTGQSRVVVIHRKEGREHCHIVWSRIDLERMTAISDSHNYRKHEEVARALEREFGHARVQGAHIEREGKPRPERTPSHAEMLQADRTGLSPRDVREQLTAIWRDTKSGQDFAVALWQSGYVLARGDRRDFVVIDPRGGTHSVSRRIEGATARDIRERLADIDPARIPNITDAKQIQRARQERDAAQQLQGKQPTGPVRIEEEEERSKRRAADGMEWTDRAGMVEQQRSAMDWAKEAQKEKSARTEQTDRKQVTNEADEARTERRQALLREFGKEFSDEQTRDLDPGRERTRR
jgi:hypothetical protein